ncbi:MAG: YcgN family cysteine cluster protein [Oceanicaulis sp.]|nr:YcgN family cysteine cluster protein [Oceanicaulis sp.]
MMQPRPFYQTKSLTEMSEAEWESLCDGCGQCCTLSLIDEDDAGETVHRTCVGCTLLDLEAVRCRDYANRHERVPSCVKLTPDNVSALRWMPQTCAYRLLAECKPLFDWHPLISGRADSVVEAGVSVKGSLVSENDIDEDDLEDYVVE